MGSLSKSHTFGVRIYLYLSNFSLENSCARTDAVFTPYPGFKSHVKGQYLT